MRVIEGSKKGPYENYLLIDLNGNFYRWTISYFYGSKQYQTIFEYTCPLDCSYSYNRVEPDMKVFSKLELNTENPRSSIEKLKSLWILK